jgi:4-hydroxybenzoate polyprenyltransferase
MPGPQPAQEGAYVPSALPSTSAVPFVATRSGVAGALLWAGLASTLHRMRRGEGALIAINLSLIALHGESPVVLTLISLLTMILMYAFNDLYDAPIDWENPKKDRSVIATYVEHRRAATVLLIALKIVTLLIALVALGPMAAAAVAGAMLVNVIYSAVFKGMPVVDVAWCGVWGAVYAAIVGAPVMLLVVVGLMTAICHLYQALDDRVSDAKVGITTTAVRSRTLSGAVLLSLSILMAAVLAGPFGPAAALTAFIPLALFFLMATARSGWLLTKVYFAAMWLALLGMPGATG